MQASPTFVAQYFDGTKQNVIPLFQRPYSWERKHWKHLWQDILDLLEAGGSNPHFMGAIVSLPAQSVAVGVSKHLIIDGQQRLTTLAILLCAVRDALEDEQQVGIVQDLLQNARYQGDDEVKLLPTHRDREAYRSLAILKSIPSKAHPIRTAYQFFEGQLKDKDNNGQKIDPAAVLRLLTNRLQVVQINLSDSDDPYLIFESLNFRGEPLTQSDLIRNYVLMKFRGVGSEEGIDKIYASYWRPIEFHTGDSIEDYLRHYATKDGAKVGRGGIYSAVKQHFESLGAEDAAIQAEFESMCRHSEYYSVFLGESAAPNANIAASLSILKELGRGAAYPLLLRIFDLFKSGHMTQSELQESVQTIESFVMRRTICDVPSNTLVRTFQALAKSMPSADTLAWLKDSLKAGEGSRRWPSDKEVSDRIENSSIYTNAPKLARLLLIAMERELEALETVDLTQTTIEHVMPQTLTQTWKLELGENFEEIHKAKLHVLGNLTLSAYNGALGNLAFADKRAKLSESTLRLNSYIASQEEWGEESIRERGVIFAEAVCRLWRR
jgi:uncharacterized protein with ParB-like and HNH nuclease domain